MDKSVFESYIEEMRRMKAAATPSAEERVIKKQKPPTPQSNNPDMAGTGYLVVNVTSVRGLFPVEGAEVTVFTGEGENLKVLATAQTDRSGKTPAFPLPAPSAAFSESPDPAERPYAFYSIKTTEDGFREQINANISVFDGVTSLQAVTLEPLSLSPEQNGDIVIDEFESYGL